MKTVLFKAGLIMAALFLAGTLQATAAKGDKNRDNEKGKNWKEYYSNGQGKGHEKDKGKGHGYDDGPGQGPGNGNGYGHNKGPKNAVPIDGGASVLLAAGAAYGLKKLRDSLKKPS